MRDALLATQESYLRESPSDFRHETGSGLETRRATMLGGLIMVVVLLVVLLVVLPLTFVVSGAIAAAVLGQSLWMNGDARVEDNELGNLNR